MPQTAENAPSDANNMNKVSEPESDRTNNGSAAKNNPATTNDASAKDRALQAADNTNTDANRPPEFGGQKGPEPTRYGDWEKNGRCTDF